MLSLFNYLNIVWKACILKHPVLLLKHFHDEIFPVDTKDKKIDIKIVTDKMKAPPQ